MNIYILNHGLTQSKWPNAAEELLINACIYYQFLT